ncbi:hypothetical protein Tco_0554733 [Tanacetum coccineum]
MSTPTYVDSETIIQADGAVRQAQLVDIDIELDPEKAPFKVEELTDSSHSSASSDSTTPLSPDHPLTHVSPTPTPT